MFVEFPSQLDWYAFTYQAEILCRGCVHGVAEDAAGVTDPGSYSLSELLTAWAERDNVDVGSIRDFDSREFPKPFESGSAVDDAACDNCGKDLEESYDNHVQQEREWLLISD